MPLTSPDPASLKYGAAQWLRLVDLIDDYEQALRERITEHFSVDSTDISILRFLFRRNMRGQGGRSKEVSAHTGIAPSTVYRRIEAMIGRGYVRVDAPVRGEEHAYWVCDHVARSCSDILDTHLDRISDEIGPNRLNHVDDPALKMIRPFEAGLDQS